MEQIAAPAIRNSSKSTFIENSFGHNTEKRAIGFIGTRFFHFFRFSSGLRRPLTAPGGRGSIGLEPRLSGAASASKLVHKFDVALQKIVLGQFAAVLPDDLL